jgi:hypothetical protein
MIYSVFDWEQGLYHYFQGPGEGLGNRPVASKVFNDGNGKGHKLEDVLPLVPPNSQAAGTGSTPKGRIAVLNRELRQSINGKSNGPATTVSGFGAELPVSDNPLISSPLLTVGLWAAASMIGYRLAVKLGKWAEKRG